MSQTSKQIAELEATVQDKTTCNRIKSLMGYVLAEFMFLTQIEKCLVVKFLIEVIEELESL